MSNEFKPGDCVINKANPDVKLVFSRSDIDNVNALCVDKEGKEISIPLIALTKCNEFVSPIYLG